jgi:hypothetical protein
MYPNITALRKDVARRLRRGESMVLYGPHGIGKTTLLRDLETRVRNAGVACGYSPQTRHLDDIQRALEQAYPGLAFEEAAQLSTRSPSSGAPDAKPGVLLLDHLTDVSSPMVGLLRRLRSGLMGVLTSVDGEVERERPRLRPWRLGALSVRMPRASVMLLRDLLRQGSADLQLPELDPDTERRLIRAAEGRPGWILQCVQLQTQGRYWQGRQLFATLLCNDTETAVQQSVLSRLPPREGNSTLEHAADD